jgi:hypothetical protein
MPKLSRWLLALGFALTIFGGKLWFIDVAGSDLPTWDQWDSEAEVVLRPWLEGWLRAKEIFHPHNEHRIVMTKLYALGLFAANGQWDGFVETVANAVLHTLSALLLLHLGRRWFRGAWLLLYAALLVALFTLPFSWENTLFGFQSPFYFLLLFSLGHIWLTLERDDFNRRWALGQLSGALALLSLASGLFSSVAVMTVIAHRGVRERRLTKQQVVTVLISSVYCVIGWLLKNDFPPHAFLRAHNAGEFIRGFFELLAWPGSALFPWALLLIVPAIVFFVRVVKSRTTSSEDAVLLGLFAWVILQCLATAYARGGSGAVLSPRYLDLLSLNVILGLVFVAREFSGRIRWGIAGAWILFVAASLAQQTHVAWVNDVEPNIARQHIQEDNVRAYLETGDSKYILNQPWGEVPYPNGEILLQRLQVPVIRSVMPPSVRRSIPVAIQAPRALPPALEKPNRRVGLSTWNLPAQSAPFSWRSESQPATTLPILRFRVAGDLGAPGSSSRLVVRSASDLIEVTPDVAPGNRWKTVSVTRPDGEWWLEVTADTRQGWFAFTEPVEVGRFTWFAEKMLKFHFVVLGIGTALLVFGGLVFVRDLRAVAP